MDKAQMLSDIKKHYKFKTNAEFARFLGITPQNLTQWYTRKTFDIHILAIKCKEISTDWMAIGEGEMLRKDKSTTINNSNTVSIPADILALLNSQAESLKEKDKQTSEAIKQTSLVIELLKEQLKKSHNAEMLYPVANIVVEEGE